MTGTASPRDGARGQAMLPVVLILGATQIVGYGTLYYSFAILAPAVARDFSVAGETLFAILSLGLLCGGLAGPRLGRMMDRYGAPRLMAAGSGGAAILLLLLAISPGIVAFGALVVAVEMVSVLVLYDAAFACLALFGGAEARRAITRLTLIAGFASTLFWPLTGWLEAAVGWRGTYGVFALLQVGLALPLHLVLARRHRPPAAGPGPSPAAAGRSETPALSGREAKLVFSTIAAGFALSGFVVSALSVHLVPVLQSAGLASGAFLASMLMGPMQVAIRLTDAVFWRGLHPLTVTVIAGAALPAALAVLVLAPPTFLAAAVFVALFGVGQGLQSIVKGTVPLALFGRAGYAELLGRLAAVRIVFTASAPYLFSAAQSVFGLRQTLVATCAVAVAAIVPFVALRRRLAAKGELRPLAA